MQLRRMLESANHCVVHVRRWTTLSFPVIPAPLSPLEQHLTLGWRGMEDTWSTLRYITKWLSLPWLLYKALPDINPHPNADPCLNNILTTLCKKKTAHLQLVTCIRSNAFKSILVTFQIGCMIKWLLQASQLSITSFSTDESFHHLHLFHFHMGNFLMTRLICAVCRHMLVEVPPWSSSALETAGLGQSHRNHEQAQSCQHIKKICLTQGNRCPINIFPIVMMMWKGLKWRRKTTAAVSEI